MTGVRSRETGTGQQVADLAPRPWVFAVVALLLTLPILGHGCHRGDHDDEPVFAPIDRHATKANSAPTPSAGSPTPSRSRPGYP